MKQASKLLVEALFIRAKYMALSLQSFCATTADAMREVNDDYKLERFLSEREMSADNIATGCLQLVGLWLNKTWLLNKVVITLNLLLLPLKVLTEMNLFEHQTFDRASSDQKEWYNFNLPIFA